MNQTHSSALKFLVISHVFLITISNILVQYSFEFFGFHSTYAAFTYPVIFILTDLTTRCFNVNLARRVILLSMLPGLLISYFIVSFIEIFDSFNWGTFFTIHIMPLRIAFACFIAYVSGQIIDLVIFQRFRNSFSWWLAPAISTTIGNLLDTLLFFSIAFYHSNNLFLKQYWPEIALIDAGFKILISLIAFVPVYGFVLHFLRRKYFTNIINKVKQSHQ